MTPPPCWRRQRDKLLFVTKYLSQMSETNKTSTLKRTTGIEIQAQQTCGSSTATQTVQSSHASAPPHPAPTSRPLNRPSQPTSFSHSICFVHNGGRPLGDKAGIYHTRLLSLSADL